MGGGFVRPLPPSSKQPSSGRYFPWLAGTMLITATLTITLILKGKEGRGMRTSSTYKIYTEKDFPSGSCFYRVAFLSSRVRHLSLSLHSTNHHARLNMQQRRITSVHINSDGARLVPMFSSYSILKKRYRSRWANGNDDRITKDTPIFLNITKRQSKLTTNFL